MSVWARRKALCVAFISCLVANAYSRSCASRRRCFTADNGFQERETAGRSTPALQSQTLGLDLALLSIVSFCSLLRPCLACTLLWRLESTTKRLHSNVSSGCPLPFSCRLLPHVLRKSLPEDPTTRASTPSSCRCGGRDLGAPAPGEHTRGSLRYELVRTIYVLQSKRKWSLREGTTIERQIINLLPRCGGGRGRVPPHQVLAVVDQDIG